MLVCDLIVQLNWIFICIATMVFDAVNWYLHRLHNQWNGCMPNGKNSITFIDKSIIIHTHISIEKYCWNATNWLVRCCDCVAIFSFAFHLPCIHEQTIRWKQDSGQQIDSHHFIPSDSTYCADAKTGNIRKRCIVYLYIDAFVLSMEISGIQTNGMRTLYKSYIYVNIYICDTGTSTSASTSASKQS